MGFNPFNALQSVQDRSAGFLMRGTAPHGLEQPTCEHVMGLFWDLIQQSQISTQRERADSLEARVRRLESELAELRRQHRQLLEVLESHFGQDLNRDGRIGG